MELFSLKDQTAFVTGAGSGIGQRIAVGLAEAGANVGCFDLANSAGLEMTVERIRALGRKAVVLGGDVTNKDSLTAAIAKLEADIGPLDIAINCAGIANAAPAEDLEQAVWQRTMDINLTGFSCPARRRRKPCCATVKAPSSTSPRCPAPSSTAACYKRTTTAPRPA